MKRKSRRLIEPQNKFLKIPEPHYVQFDSGISEGRWFIIAGAYHISEVGFETKRQAQAWFRDNKIKLFS